MPLTPPHADPAPTPHGNPDAHAAPHDHHAVIYADDAGLCAAIAAEFADPLRAGDTVVVIATASHLAGFDAALRRRDVDVVTARRTGRYVEFDAARTLDELMTGEVAPGARLDALLREHLRDGHRLHVFGEMVTVLWERGLIAAAMDVEEQWNALIAERGFGLICAYPQRVFADERRDHHYEQVRALHSSVTHTEQPLTPFDGNELELTDAEGGDGVTDVLDALDCQLVVLDGSGRILAVNAAWRTFGEANGGVDIGIGADYFAACEASDEPTAHEALAGLWALAGGAIDVFRLDYPCHSPTERRWFRLNATRVPGPGPTRLVVRHEAVTTERLALEDAHLRVQLLDAIDTAIIVTDLDGIIEVWNGAAERLYGWSAAEALGRDRIELTVPRERWSRARDAMLAVLVSGGREGDFDLVHRDGSPRSAFIQDRIVRDERGAPRGILRVAVDLSHRVAMERELARSNAWLRAMTERMGDGLCTLDAEGRIVYVNPQGERLLAAPGHAVIGGSFVNRLFGKLPDGSAGGLGDQLIGAAFDGTVPGEVTEDRLLRSDGSVLPIEYVATELPTDPDGRRNGWVIVFRDISARLEEQAEFRANVEHGRWMTRIQEALEHDRFVLHAQPIVELATGRTLHHELLIRLETPGEALIPPGAFLPTAEAYGLAPAIDRWVIGQAIAIAAAGFPVELNLSARSLSDPSLPYVIERLLLDAGADPGNLVFEITETALLEDNEVASRFAHRVRALGCKLALDDFGTGYGAFTYLKHLPIDLLKIDIEFVRDALVDPGSRHVITAVVALARAFDIVTVAEGVEDEATMALLVELGVDRVQGFLLGHPEPLDRMERPRTTDPSD